MKIQTFEILIKVFKKKVLKKINHLEPNKLDIDLWTVNYLIICSIDYSLDFKSSIELNNLPVRDDFKVVT